MFAGVTDMTILPLYAYGVLSARNQAGSGPDTEWRTLLNDQSTIKTLVPAVYYGLIGAGGLHLISLAISLYLGVMFRRISMMPPDMNPLEGHLTSRAHKRSKSSIATSIYAESEKRFSTPSERHPATIAAGDVSRPRSVPFMHTREGSRDSRMELPSRQYQIAASNSPRNSTTDLGLKRMSAPARGAYSEISLNDDASGRSRPDSSYSSYKLPAGTVPSYLTDAIRTKPTPPLHGDAPPTPPPRAPKFTEAWYASESLVNRTQERTRALNQLAAKRRTYEPVSQPYDISPESDSENEGRENDYSHPNASSEDHPNPLRLHPTASKYSEYAPEPPTYAPEPAPPVPVQRRPKTPFARVRNSVLSAISLNDRRVSGDITDGGNRNSSITADSAFYSKPYGDLRPATPPVMIGGRQVSSGNDYDLGSGAGVRGRHVSGKIVEEGRAGGRFSRYDAVDE